MKSLIFGLALLVLSACTHIAATIPTPMVEAPELSGRASFVPSLDFSGDTGGFRYQTTGSANTRPPDLSAPGVTQMGTVHGGASLDFINRFRVGAGIDGINGGWFTLAQVQVLGDGVTQAKAGNFSLSLFGHAGQNHTTSSGDQAVQFGPGGYPWTAKLNADWYSFGASIGYRFGNPAAVFLAAAKEISFYSTSDDQTSGPAPNGYYTADDRGEANKGALGVSWSNDVTDLAVIASYSEGKFQKAPASYIGAIGLQARIYLK